MAIKLATGAILAVVTGGLLSLVFGFSLKTGFHHNPPPANVVHTTVKMYNPPPAHWGKLDPHVQPGRHHTFRIRIHVP